MSFVDTHQLVHIEAPMGSETIVVQSDGRIKRIPFVNNQIDWKAFEEAVNKINKLRKANETDIHLECTTPDREGHNCCGSSETD